MEISYLELISPEPIYHDGIGVRCPTLREIRQHRKEYNYYLMLLSLSPYDYYKSCNLLHLYEELSDEAKVYLTMYDLIVQIEPLRHSYADAFNFFIDGQVVYNAQTKCYEFHSPQEDGNLAVSGVISRDNFTTVSKIILERNFIKSEDNNDVSEIKNEKALRIAMKLQKGREQKKQTATPDSDMELGNIISAVVAYKESVNYLNIWDYTVYQLWDSFYRHFNKMVYDKENMSTSIWGDKTKQFKITNWYKKINDK